MTGHFNVQLRKSIPSILSEKHNRFTFLNLVIMRYTNRHVDRLTDSVNMISNVQRLPGIGIQFKAY